MNRLKIFKRENRTVEQKTWLITQSEFKNLIFLIIIKLIITNKWLVSKHLSQHLSDWFSLNLSYTSNLIWLVFFLFKIDTVFSSSYSRKSTLCWKVFTCKENVREIKIRHDILIQRAITGVPSVFYLSKVISVISSFLFII